MGTSRSPFQLAEKLERYAKKIETDVVNGGMKEAVAVTKRALETARAEAGAPSGRLRNVGKNGAPLGILTSVTPGAVDAVGRLRATGPWHLLESDIKPHRIPRLKGATSKGARGAKRPTYGPAFMGVRAGTHPVKVGQNVYDHVWHPGTKGKHPWAKGKAVAEPLVVEAYRLGLLKAGASIF